MAESSFSATPNKAKSSFTSGTLGSEAYAKKALGSVPPKKSVEEINKANSPKSREYASGVIRHGNDGGRAAAGAETK